MVRSTYRSEKPEVTSEKAVRNQCHCQKPFDLSLEDNDLIQIPYCIQNNFSTTLFHKIRESLLLFPINIKMNNVNSL